MNSLVSIIIPCYNAERWIFEAIDSAFSQTYPYIEVIVIDDGSTDTSLSIIKSYGSKIKWETDFNRGGSGARNRGFKLSQGEYIQWLDADDYLEATKIEDQVSVATEHKNSVVYGPWLNRIELGGNSQLGRRNLLEAVSDPLATHLKGLLAPTIAFLTPRTVFEEIGGWDEELLADQDGDLFMRFMLHGTPFVYASGGAAIWRHHQSPNRVSNRRSLAALLSRYQVCCRVIEKLQQQNKLDQYAELLAWRLDRLAQLAALEYPSFAEQCLKKSIEIHPNCQPLGSFAYKLSRKAFGLQGSENLRLLYQKLKKAINPGASEIPAWILKL
jgi:glycosyltransferase involved in cell wall biosynthesis